MLITFDSRIGNAFIEYFDHFSLEIYVNIYLYNYYSCKKCTLLRENSRELQLM